jgi:hypothetical protein
MGNFNSEMRTTRKSSDENARNGKYSNVNEGWFW